MNVALNNILVPTDFSPANKQAFNAAIKLCKQHKAVLHLMYVLESRYIVASPAFNVKIPDISHDFREKARKRLDAEYESIITSHQIKVQIHMPTGIPHDEICKVASEMPIDLIVMGTTGASGGKLNAVGTNCYQVIKNSVKSVLTVPWNYEFMNSKQILFPVRPGCCVREKYEFLRRFLGSAEAEIHVATLSVDGEEAFLLKNKEKLPDLIIAQKDAGLSFIRKSYTCNSYSSKVLELAEDTGADLVVINATLYYNWIEFFLGPFTSQLISSSKLPVLSFRHGVNILSENRDGVNGLKSTIRASFSV